MHLAADIFDVGGVHQKTHRKKRFELDLCLLLPAVFK